MNTSAARLASFAVLVLLVSHGRLAMAADRVALVVGGSKGKEMETVSAVARERVELGRWTFVETTLAEDRRAEAIACVAGDRDKSCVAELLDELGADRVLALRLATETHDGEKVRVVTGSVLRRGGDIVDIQQRFCERCNDDLLRAQVADLVDSLIKNAKATLLPATLVVRSDPPGARVRIDDELVGTTEVEYGVFAGKHVIQVEKDGYVAETRTVSIGDGERLEQDFELLPTDEGPTPPPPARSRLAPWLVVGAGGALMLGGGVLALVVDEDGRADDGDRLRSYRDTAPLGVGVAIAGAATAAVGVVWLLRSGRGDPPRDGATPVISVERDAVYLGAVGRF